MDIKKLISIIMVILGVVLIVYGINHMNTAGAKIADFFGQKDSTGMFTIIAGVILAITGAITATKK